MEADWSLLSVDGVQEIIEQEAKVAAASVERRVGWDCGYEVEDLIHQGMLLTATSPKSVRTKLRKGGKLPHFRTWIRSRLYNHTRTEVSRAMLRYDCKEAEGGDLRSG